jgi:hypothetical protein
MTVRPSKNFRGAKDGARRGAIAALIIGSDHVLEEADRIVPIEEAVLQDSGDTEVDEAGLRAAIGYGGEASAYAVKQHEDMTLQHDPGRQAKFLEQPMDEYRPEFPALVSSCIKAELKRELLS